VSFVREKPGAASLVGLAAAVAGLVIGRTAVGVAGRSAANPEQAARRRYAVLLAVMVLGAALLIIDAIDTRGAATSTSRFWRSWLAASPSIGLGAGDAAHGRNPHSSQTMNS
jgi:F0F1-type ATP synthase membrane subunit c/vacuolar-type H+-ATPase subunit K